MPYDASPEYPNALGLSPENYAIMQELLAWLDKGGDDECAFYYGAWHSDCHSPKGAPCGTHACIGGWLSVRTGEGVGYSAADRASNKLGLSMDDADALFQDAMGRGVTAPIAARCVRYLLATGKVDWDRAFAEVDG